MLSRSQSVFTYTSMQGSQQYLFDVVVNGLGYKAVRNIRGPKGLVTDSLTQVPQAVVEDINNAMALADLSSAESVVLSGDVTFEGETVIAVVLPPDTVHTTEYHVVFETPDGTALVVEDKTINGFNIVAPYAYGGDTSKEVGWALYVATAPNVTLSGDVVLSAADVSTKTVVFPSPLATNAYRIALFPSEFVPVRVVSKTKTGFTLGIGVTLTGLQTCTVGYAIFA